MSIKVTTYHKVAPKGTLVNTGPTYSTITGDNNAALNILLGCLKEFKSFLNKGENVKELDDLYFAIGKTYMDMGEYELARDHFKLMRETSPYAILTNVKIIGFQLGKYDEAIKMLEVNGRLFTDQQLAVQFDYNAFLVDLRLLQFVNTQNPNHFVQYKVLFAQFKLFYEKNRTDLKAETGRIYAKYEERFLASSKTFEEMIAEKPKAEEKDGCKEGESNHNTKKDDDKRPKSLPVIDKKPSDASSSSKTHKDAGGEEPKSSKKSSDTKVGDKLVVDVTKIATKSQVFDEEATAKVLVAFKSARTKEDFTNISILMHNRNINYGALDGNGNSVFYFLSTNSRLHNKLLETDRVDFCRLMIAANAKGKTAIGVFLSNLANDLPETTTILRYIAANDVTRSCVEDIMSRNASIAKKLIAVDWTKLVSNVAKTERVI